MDRDGLFARAHARASVVSVDGRASRIAPALRDLFARVHGDVGAVGVRVVGAQPHRVSRGVGRGGRSLPRAAHAGHHRAARNRVLHRVWAARLPSCRSRFSRRPFSGPSARRASRAASLVEISLSHQRAARAAWRVARAQTSSAGADLRHEQRTLRRFRFRAAALSPGRSGSSRSRCRRSVARARSRQ